jgi:hypothetical protein
MKTGQGFLLAAVCITVFAAHGQSPPSSEVHRLFLEDQKDRGVGGESLPWDKIEPRDRTRRERVHQLLSQDAVKTAGDFHDAAYIYQHGQASSDYLLAHVLATVAVQKGDTSSLWISAATLDRYLISIRQSQIFGTQYNSANNGPTTQDPYDKVLVPDKLRLVFCVPGIEQQQKNLAEFNAGKYPEGVIPTGCTR